MLEWLWARIRRPAKSNDSTAIDLDRTRDGSRPMLGETPRDAAEQYAEYASYNGYDVRREVVIRDEIVFVSRYTEPED